MTDRKNIKVPVETYERLKNEKGQYETWKATIQTHAASSQVLFCRLQWDKLAWHSTNQAPTPRSSCYSGL
jgi:hypothetical protein